MAQKLNKIAGRCEEIALMSGTITPNSSAQPLFYDISRHWRALQTATSFRTADGEWNEKEILAADLMIATLGYLNRIGCKDIERLLNDRMNRQLQ